MTFIQKLDKLKQDLRVVVKEYCENPPTEVIVLNKKTGKRPMSKLNLARRIGDCNFVTFETKDVSNRNNGLFIDRTNGILLKIREGGMKGNGAIKGLDALLTLYESLMNLEYFISLHQPSVRRMICLPKKKKKGFIMINISKYYGLSIEAEVQEIKLMKHVGERVGRLRKLFKMLMLSMARFMFACQVCRMQLLDAELRNFALVPRESDPDIIDFIVLDEEVIKTAETSRKWTEESSKELAKENKYKYHDIVQEFDEPGFMIKDDMAKMDVHGFKKKMHKLVGKTIENINAESIANYNKEVLTLL